MIAPKPTFMILDGHSMAYRHYHGMRDATLTSPLGEPVGAVFAFARQLMDIIYKQKPEYIAVAFDAGLSGRDVQFGDYKAHRPETPHELSVQVDKMREVIQAYNIPILELAGFEADDVIGTVSRQASAQGIAVQIITGDSDLLQLITDDVQVYLHRPFKEPLLHDQEAFHHKYGLRLPQQLIDLKALEGDTSDNIPGVQGIGKKTATTLLQTYHSLDGVYDHLDELSGSVRKKLAEGRESAYLSRRLATIQTDLDLQVDLSACHTQSYDASIIRTLFVRLGFTSLLKRLTDEVGGTVRAAVQPSDDFDQPTLFEIEEVALVAGGVKDAPLFAVPPHASDLVRCVIVRDQTTLDELVTVLNEAHLIAFDTETTGIDPMSSDLVGISVSTDGEVGYYLPVGHQDEMYSQLPTSVVVEALRPSFENPAIPKAAHNATYDYLMLLRQGIRTVPITEDTMVAEYVGNNSPDIQLGLKQLVQRAGLVAPQGVQMQEISDLIGSGKKQITMAVVPVSKAAPYAVQDAAMTWRLVKPLREQLQRVQGLTRVYDEIEIPLIPVISDMEQAGVKFDLPYLAEMSQRLDEALKALERQAHEHSGGYGDFNLSSPKQLNDVLFGKLGLPRQGIPKTAHGNSTAANILEKLWEQSGHPILKSILEYRELSKLKGTYVDALPALVNAVTGRVHTSFNQAGSSTGRISSSNPNLQNIPIRTEIGREVRRAVIAEEGNVLLSVDYSQVELRIMAHMADEPYLQKAFMEGQDIHRATGALIFDTTVDAISSDQRSFAKRINFGLLYGMGAFRLARDSELTLAEANLFIKTYFERLPKVKQYMENMKTKLHQEGFTETLLGRRRYYGDIKGSAQQRAAAERIAINMPIQGTAADIMKLAMIQLHRRLNQEGFLARMLLQVHDELVLEVPSAEATDVAQVVVEVMQTAYPMTPILVANAEVGLNWRDMNAVSF